MTADLPAKAVLLNMKQYDGTYRCNLCEDEGVPRAYSHLQKDWPHKGNMTLKTHIFIEPSQNKRLSMDLWYAIQ